MKYLEPLRTIVCRRLLQQFFGFDQSGSVDRRLASVLVSMFLAISSRSVGAYSCEMSDGARKTGGPSTRKFLRTHMEPC